MKVRYLSVLVFAIACGKSAAPPAGAGSGSASAVAPAPDPVRAATAGKMKAAVECLNHYSKDAFVSVRTYLDKVDATTGAPTDPGKLPLMGLPGVELCQLRLKTADAITPAVPELDTAFKSYVASATELDAAWNALRGYYDKGENIDDKGAKAASLHTSVVAAFAKFRAAQRALHAAVRKLTREASLAMIAAREKAEGRKLDVIIEAMMVEADDLVELATGAEPDDAAALEASTAAYGKLDDEMHAYAAAHADETKTHGSWANLQNYANTFLGAVKTVARKVHDKAPVTDDERRAVSEQYNFLVQNYNNH